MKRLIVASALGLSMGCSEEAPPLPTQVNIDINNTATNNAGSGAAQPGVNPTTGACVVSRLAGGIFGDEGGAACVGRLAGQIKVGCTVIATITPKRADNTDASPAEHGNALSYSDVRNSGVVQRLEDGENPFNYTMRASGVGDGSGYALKATLVVPGCPAAFERIYEFPIQPGS